MIGRLQPFDGQPANGTDGDGATFRPIATTMMACPKAMVSKTAFTKTLAQVKGVKIREQELDPFDSHGQLAIRLEAAYMK